MPRAALTIAGSDPTGGAGLQADLKTFAAFGVYGASAVTAVTVQDTAGVTAVEPLSADLVAAQIEAVASDLTLHATKIGMLGTSAIVEAVIAAIAALDLPMVVLDPVLISSSGSPLLDQDGVRALVGELLPRVRVVTPNIPEAEVLTGLRIESPSTLRRAAARLCEMGAAAAIVTGGHGAGSDIVNVLCEGDTLVEFRVARVEVGRTHGTGCTFASAVAAGLALGDTLGMSIERAQAYVAGAVTHAVALGRGAVLLDHFWK